MIKTSIAAAIGISIAAAAFGAQAQDSNMKPADGKTMSSTKPAMSSSSMTKEKMSDADMKTMKMCQGMEHGAMMKDQKCMDMMKMHPDMMKSK